MTQKVKYEVLVNAILFMSAALKVASDGNAKAPAWRQAALEVSEFCLQAVDGRKYEMSDESLELLELYAATVETRNLMQLLRGTK